MGFDATPLLFPGLQCGFTYPDFRGTGKRKRRAVSLSGTEETAPKQRILTHFQLFRLLVAPLSAPTLRRSERWRYFFCLSAALTGSFLWCGGGLGGCRRSLEAARVEPGLKGCGHGRGRRWWDFSVGARTADVVSPGPESSGGRGAAGPGREGRQLPGAGQ